MVARWAETYGWKLNPLFLSLIGPGIAAGILLAVITALVLWFGRWRRYLIVGWFWYIGTLVPVIGLIQVGIQARADRYTYIPSIGIYWLVVWGACELASRWERGVWVLRAAAVAVLLCCTVLTWRQVSYWTDSETLFRQSIRAIPDSYFANNHLGKELDARGMKEDTEARLAAVGGRAEEAAEHLRKRDLLRKEAMEQFKKTVEINPMYDFGNNNLGVSYARLKKNQEAKRLFLQAVYINPDYADAHNNLCVIFSEEHDYAKAILHGEKATQIRPDEAGYHVNLGIAYEGQNRLKEAETEYRRAIRCNPDFVNAYFRLGLLSAQTGDLQTAARCFGKCVQLDPRNEESHYFLGMVLVRLGNLTEAKEQARRGPTHQSESCPSPANAGRDPRNEGEMMKEKG